MVRSVYVETTVASYFTARPSRDLMIAGHQEATRELWPKPPIMSRTFRHWFTKKREEAIPTRRR
jgi:hypothetical protein